MRIRFYKAFASNNSGAYVLLGRFHGADVAQSAARELNAALAEHDAWATSLPPPQDPSPFIAFAAKHGLSMQNEWVPWAHGMRCEVLGEQVLLEGVAPDMPSAFVGWVAQHGGHVETEIVHAHGATVVRVHAWVHDGWREENRERARATLVNFIERVKRDAEVLGALAPRRWGEADRAVHVASLDHPTDLLLAPRNITRATKAIRALADAEEVRILFHVFEWIDNQLDPAAVVAEATGNVSFDVMLEDPGPTPELVSAALTQVTGMEPSLAAHRVSTQPTRRTGLPEPWPRRVVQRVTRAHADELIEVLRSAGAAATCRRSALG